ncbi:phage tail assembly chaperone G [Pseudobacillus badius]|uniref:phage tail assembly chaperone G n=1 Tax=Bacillus badius TaxID=1455 RepID=UPI0007B38DE0|nr:hypothetical protein [Bacillus badius]KZR60386.1 hypothetical protein A3781_09445 [Bacillus badius]
MKLPLMINGEERIFVAPFIPARILRKLLEMQTRINLDKMTIDETDEVVGLICDAFGNQFTIDEYWDGVAAEDFNDNLLEFMMHVNGAKKQEKTQGKKEEATAGK